MQTLQARANRKRIQSSRLSSNSAVNYDRSHEKAVKSVVQYLYHTSHLAVTYFRDGNEFSSEKNTATVWEAGCHPLDWNKNENERFKVFTDVSFGDDIVT